MTNSQTEHNQGTEPYIREVVEAAEDLRWSSLELARLSRGVRDDYHLSPARAGLLMPLNISRQHSVLEIGAGMGAITRYLAETAGQVVAVEENPKRASIISSRCRDLENVDVVTSSVRDLSLGKKFDVVSLIDLEKNCQGYFDENNSSGNLLAQASQWLKENGVIILATDNKLGLRYFAGLKDDGWDRYFEGVEGYPGGSELFSYGKQEMLELAEQAGFSATTMLYPFPDFRFPRTIINQHARLSLSKKPYLYQWLGFETAPEGVGERTYHLFRENLVLKQLENNGLLGDMANSFLLIASRTKEGLESFVDTSVQLYKYNPGRKREFMTAAALMQSKDGPKIVAEALFPDESGTDGPIVRNLANGNGARTWLEGPTLMHRIAESIAFTKSDPDLSVGPIMVRWYEHLKERSHRGESGAELLPGKYWDCTLWNLIDNGGKLIFIDRELEYKESVPIKYVLFRGIFKVYEWMPISLEKTYFNGKLKERSIVEFAKHMMSLVGESVEEEEIDSYLELEWQCYEQLSIKKTPPFANCLYFWKDGEYARIRNLCSLEQQLDSFRQQARELEDQISSMERSKFWRLRLLFRRFMSLLPWR